LTTPLILTLDSQGAPVKWVTWQDAVTYETKNAIAWRTGEMTFTFSGGVSRMTGEISKITTSSIIALKGDATRSRWNKALVGVSSAMLFSRDCHICAYCGKRFGANDLTRDHIIPKSKGGENSWMNVVTACRRCNGIKGDRLLQETNLGLLYVPYIPSRVENLILANRKILGDQMDLLKAYLPKHSRILKNFEMN